MSDEMKLSERVRTCAYIAPDPHPTDTEAGEREVLGLNQVADEIAALEKRLAEAERILRDTLDAIPGEAIGKKQIVAFLENTDD